MFINMHVVVSSHPPHGACPSAGYLLPLDEEECYHIQWIPWALFGLFSHMLTIFSSRISMCWGNFLVFTRILYSECLFYPLTLHISRCEQSQYMVLNHTEPSGKCFLQLLPLLGLNSYEIAWGNSVFLFCAACSSLALAWPRGTPGKPAF